MQNLYFCLFIRWKIAGNVPGIELRLSDKRLFQIISHIQLIHFPELKSSMDNDQLFTETEVHIYINDSLNYI